MTNKTQVYDTLPQVVEVVVQSKNSQTSLFITGFSAEFVFGVVKKALEAPFTSKSEKPYKKRKYVKRAKKFFKTEKTVTKLKKSWGVPEKDENHKQLVTA